jgi:hypothetical protein
VKRLFEDHLNKQNDKLMEEKHEHMSTKRSLAEVKATLDIQTSEKMNLENKVKNQEERIINQEEIMKVQEERIINQEEKFKVQEERIIYQEEKFKVQEERIIYQEGKMKEQERFIDEENVKLNELYRLTKMLERENLRNKQILKIFIGMAICGTILFIRK